MRIRKGSRETIYAWAFYDWANSAYALVISTAIFPIYYESVTQNSEGVIHFFGMPFNNTSLYTYSLSFSFLVIAFLSPILSGIADYMGNKKRFMQFFCYLGSFSVMSLYFFTGIETLWIGLLFTVLASIGFWGSLVFYNAFLPEVAFPKQQDRVSALGFMLGYFGSVFLLLFNLSMVLNPHWYGITDPTLPSRISFLSVGIWWFGFSQYTFYVLPNNIYNNKKPKRDVFFNGFKALKKVAGDLAFYPQLRTLLIAFFLYSIGVQTTILLSTIYGKKELGLETSNLIITILLV
ncbi:MAG: MFS transporter, partial [Flavobacteriaceae bacterium]|nr:MFS transporter [Flavobacteriaceae bacterium]